MGIKFYPKRVTPELVVTSHRLRTGVGNDWVLNRERVEEALLRAGYPLDLNEPRLPVGNILGENPGNGLALLSIPPMDEMGHGWTDIAWLTEEQYQKRLVERATKAKTTTNNNQQ